MTRRALPLELVMKELLVEGAKLIPFSIMMKMESTMILCSSGVRKLLSMCGWMIE